MWNIINRPIQGFFPEPEEIESVIWIRDYPEEYDEFKNGEVMKWDIANHYVRRGSHWRKFISYKEPE
jgi:hypothetical protein